MDQEIERVIRAMQTSVHDQLGALKADVQKVTSDSEAVLEICAELERSVNVDGPDKQRIQHLYDTVHSIVDISIREARANDLNFRRLGMLSGMNHLCWHLSVLTFMKMRVCADDPKALFSCVEPLFRLRHLYDDISARVKSAEKTDDLIPIAEELADKYVALQGEVQEPPPQFLSEP